MKSIPSFSGPKQTLFCEDEIITRTTLKNIPHKAVSNFSVLPRSLQTWGRQAGRLHRPNKEKKKRKKNRWSRNKLIAFIKYLSGSAPTHRQPNIRSPQESCTHFVYQTEIESELARCSLLLLLLPTIILAIFFLILFLCCYCAAPWWMSSSPHGQVHIKNASVNNYTMVVGPRYGQCIMSLTGIWCCTRDTSAVDELCHDLMFEFNNCEL